jgi:hypothetical protein
MPPRDLVKFGLLIALAAIFIDAAVAHGLFWDNDPYWTYWITKTFLIATVFIVGTGLIGAGLVQGAVITAAHTLILEIYYQWLAPVGLPQEPEWLDFNHLWITGVPVHYLAIFAGYLMALWLWRLNRPAEAERASAETRGLAAYAVGVGVLIVALDGVITQGVLLRDFPGLTFFVQHILIGVVFVAVWGAYTPKTVASAIVGALMLALVWTAYGMYLGPRGLPNSVPVYSGYGDLWLRSFPGHFVAVVLGLLLAHRFASDRLLPRRAAGPGGTMAAGAVLAAVLFVHPGEVRAQSFLTDPRGLPASSSASGEAMRVVGPNPVDMRRTVPASGRISIRTIESGNRWSHVQNIDVVEVRSTFTSGDATYEVIVNQPMPRHPHGAYTTWSGVVYGHQMHGETGIGSDRLPKMRPDIALWGWGEVRRNGEVLTRTAPVHVMATSKGPMKGMMLEVHSEDRALVGDPEGYLTVMWPRLDQLETPKDDRRVREMIGWFGLGGITVLFGVLAHRARRPRLVAPAQTD